MYNLWYSSCPFSNVKAGFGLRLQITMEDLQIVEFIVRKDPKVIEQCQIIGIPKEDMHKVYCDREYDKSAWNDPLLIGNSMDDRL